MNSGNKVQCATHGWQDEAFVCKHIVESLRSSIGVGFHWPANSDQLHPDAWCTSCEEARLSVGGEWTPEVEKVLDIQLPCGSCYEHAKSIWENGRKLTQ